MTRKAKAILIGVGLICFSLSLYLARYPTDLADPRMRKFTDLFEMHSEAVYQLADGRTTEKPSKATLIVQCDSVIALSDEILKLRQSKEVPQFYPIIKGIAESSKNMAIAFKGYLQTGETRDWRDMINYEREADNWLTQFIEECEQITP